jgi:two-component system response regulator NreC
MSPKIQVAILDDHQSIVDGYNYRLSQSADIEIVGTAGYGEQLEPMLAKNRVDVLILDIEVPTSPANSNPYPILYEIPKIIEKYPNLNVLVISMHNQASMIKSIMDMGASGYILKADYTMIKELAKVVSLVAQGSNQFSNQARLHYEKKVGGDVALTPRQLKVLSLCAAFPDATTGELAKQLEIANSTVRNLLSEAYVRLDVRNRAAAVAKARQLGLITPLSNNGPL